MADEGDSYRQVINNVQIKGLEYVKPFVFGLSGETETKFEGAKGKVNFIFYKSSKQFLT